MDNIFDTKISSKSKLIQDQAKSLVLKDKGKVSRILYCGPNYSGQGMSLFKLIEVQYNDFYVEKTLFDYHSHSINTSLLRIPVYSFGKYQTPDELKTRKYSKTYDMNLASFSHYRGTESGHLRTNVILDKRERYPIMLLNDFYTFWLLRGLSNK